nr:MULTISPECIES: adenine deaminase C-terminal domain-containing protein [unclassified Bradyrhizobium]
MSTDNLAVEHMMRVGHLDVAIKDAVARGLDPITAIKMTSYNTAKHFKMEDKLGSLTPGRFADIVLVDDLRSFTPRYVFKGGQLVAQDGKLLRNATIDYTSLVTRPTRGLDDFKLGDLKVKPIEVSADRSRAKVTVFNFFGFGPQGFSHDVWLPMANGEIVPELNGEKLLHFAIIQRYAKDNQRTIVTGFIRQFPMKSGAVAVGFSAPRPNVITMGTNLNDMYVALKEADKSMGGFVAADAGSVKQAVPMAIYGMMTDYSVSELIKRSDKLDEALDAMGHKKSGTAVNTLLEVFYLADRHGFLE